MTVSFRVALLLSGGGVSKGRASGLAGLVQSGSGNFSFAIVDVTVLGTYVGGVPSVRGIDQKEVDH